MVLANPGGLALAGLEDTLDRVFNPVTLGLTFQHDAAGQDSHFGNFLTVLVSRGLPFLTCLYLLIIHQCAQSAGAQGQFFRQIFLKARKIEYFARKIERGRGCIIREMTQAIWREERCYFMKPARFKAKNTSYSSCFDVMDLSW